MAENTLKLFSILYTQKYKKDGYVSLATKFCFLSNSNFFNIYKMYIIPSQTDWIWS
jgi:hypothetical protein